MAPLADVAPGEERSDALAKSILYKMTALSMLDQNGLIEIVGETVTVKGHMDPEDVIITIPGEAAEEIIPETLKEHNVTMAVTVTPVPEHLLIFGPEAIIDGDLDTIDEIIDDLGIDEEEYISFRAGVSMKRAVIARTLEILEERGTLTPEEAGDLAGGRDERHAVDRADLAAPAERLDDLLDRDHGASGPRRPVHSAGGVEVSSCRRQSPGSPAKPASATKAESRRGAHAWGETMWP